MEPESKTFPLHSLTKNRRLLTREISRGPTLPAVMSGEDIRLSQLKSGLRHCPTVLLGKLSDCGLDEAMQVVLNYLKQHQARFLAEFFDYLRFASVSAQPQHKPDLLACAQWLVAHCRDIGLDARLCPTKGHPIVIAKTKRDQKARKPHYLVYGHYDVQPPEPLDLWTAPPFEPRRVGRNVFARGSTDNKGQNFAHLKAVEAYLKTGTPLPCDLTFVIEGEEEVGSKSLSDFLKQHRRELTCDAIVVSDTGMPAPSHPALTYGLRGIIAFEITLHGPARDLHSGIFGGAVENPAMALAQLLAKVRDDSGRVKIPGFYNGVVPLSKYEREQIRRYPLKDAQLKKLLGAPAWSASGASPPPSNAVPARPSRSTASPAAIRAKAAKPLFPLGPGPRSPAGWCPIRTRLTSAKPFAPG
jgi:acetylornithine deacetylase/succinyl-diaminopimelate desuccinylase-like protein